jgi:hypothetical protein
VGPSRRCSKPGVSLSAVRDNFSRIDRQQATLLARRRRLFGIARDTSQARLAGQARRAVARSVRSVPERYSPDFHVIHTLLSTGVEKFLADNLGMEMLDIYADESCTGNHRYLVLGGIALERTFAEVALGKLKDVRSSFSTHGEVKWSKVSGGKLDFYKAFVDVFFDCSANDDVHFYSLYVDTSTFNHHRFNGGNAEIGFNKLIYQLLLHKFGRKYGKSYGLHVHLDDRTTKHNPEDMRPMLNSELGNKWGVTGNPFRRMAFQDSKKSDLIQLNDLLVGTVGFKKNLHHTRPECSPHKIALANHIVRRALENEKPYKLNSRHAKRFAVWEFEYRKR